MNSIYIPYNIDQTFSLIVYSNGLYCLMETNMEKEQPMYMGKDRIKVETIIKNIKKASIKQNTKNTKLKIYKVDSEGNIKFTPQSSFYNIIPND
jgi:hypothetical protein